MVYSVHDTFEKRRNSVPANAISYISTESVSSRTDLSKQQQPFIIKECRHKKIHGGGSSYRCEKHGGGGHQRIFNGSSLETPIARRRHKSCYSNTSSSVPAIVSDSHSDSGKKNNLIYFKLYVINY